MSMSRSARDRSPCDDESRRRVECSQFASGVTTAKVFLCVALFLMDVRAAAMSEGILAVAPACRGRFAWPFASNSIWNTPIGSGAVYADAGIYADDAYPTVIHNDQVCCAVVLTGGRERAQRRERRRRRCRTGRLTAEDNRARMQVRIWVYTYVQLFLFVSLPLSVCLCPYMLVCLHATTRLDGRLWELPGGLRCHGAHEGVRPAAGGPRDGLRGEQQCGGSAAARQSHAPADAAVLSGGRGRAFCRVVPYRCT